MYRNSNNGEASSSRGHGSGGHGRGRGSSRGGWGGPLSGPKAERARLAKDLINTVVLNVLQHNAKAQAGVDNVEFLRGLIRQLHPATSPAPFPVKVISSDTFDAAQTLATAHPGAKVAVLNMCSLFQPGGGVLRGAAAQEESLCLRSTLYASLKPEFYRFPDDAVIYTPDVYVFRNGDNSPLPTADCFYVDVISCAAPRQPPVEHGQYVDKKDEETMANKMRLIMRAAVEKKVEYLVLGAFGCGAYGNPNRVVSEMFKRVLLGKEGRTDSETWGTDLKEVVFAIFGRDSNLEVFSACFTGSDAIGTTSTAAATSADSAALPV